MHADCRSEGVWFPSWCVSLLILSGMYNEHVSCHTGPNGVLGAMVVTPLESCCAHYVG